MNTEKTIEVLNTLIEINNDRIEGYETASKETNEDDLKALFTQLAGTSETCKTELIDEVEQLGGTHTEGTKTTGKFFRVWMDVKAALTGKDRSAILSSCEYGEEVAVKTYQDVLDNHSEELTDEQLDLIEEQSELIQADHDTVKSLLDALTEVESE
jgi:uncharacterized protein (TIGR02284 family)